MPVVQPPCLLDMLPWLWAHRRRRRERTGARQVGERWHSAEHAACLGFGSCPLPRGCRSPPRPCVQGTIRSGCMRALRFGLRIACCQVWVRAGMCIMCLVGGMSMTRLRLLGQSHVHASCQRRRQHRDSLKNTHTKATVAGSSAGPAGRRRRRRRRRCRVVGLPGRQRRRLEFQRLGPPRRRLRFLDLASHLRAPPSDDGRQIWRRSPVPLVLCRAPCP